MEFVVGDIMLGAKPGVCSNPGLIGGSGGGFEGAHTVCNDTAFEVSRSKPCYIVSIGIARDYGFDSSLHHERGCVILGFDHTVKHSSSAFWQKEGTYYFTSMISTTTVPADTGEYSIASLHSKKEVSLDVIIKTAMEVFHVDTVDIVKIDCEGCEWKVLQTLARNTWIPLHVKQFLFEFHAREQPGNFELTQASRGQVQEIHEGYTLLRTFFQSHFVHLNPFQPPPHRRKMFPMWSKNKEHYEEFNRLFPSFSRDSEQVLSTDTYFCCFEISFVNNLWIDPEPILGNFQSINQMWKTTTVSPPFDEAWQASWGKIHDASKWQYRFMTDDQADAFLSREYSWLLPVIANFKLKIMKFDLLRYLMVYEHGGIYADMDMEALKDITSLLQSSTKLVLARRYPQCGAPNKRCGNHQDLAQCVFASSARHPFWLHIIAEIINRQHWHRPMSVAGPKLVSDVYFSLVDGHSHHIEDAAYYKEVSNASVSTGTSSGITTSSVAPHNISKLEQEIVLSGLLVVPTPLLFTTDPKRSNMADAFAMHHFTGSWLADQPIKP